MQKRGFELSDATHGLTRPGIVNSRVFHQVRNKKRCLVLPIPMPTVEDAMERGQRAGPGRGGRGRGANATILRKASEVAACKELEGHIFTIGSGNKGKDDDMLRTSMEKMGTYIGTKFGDEATQEWISGKKIIPPEPAYSQAVLLRHAARVKATKDRIELKLKRLRTEKSSIQAKIMSAPTD
jgi:hypothetical protein